MPIDWTFALQELADFVKQLADDVAHTLSNVQVLRIHQMFTKTNASGRPWHKRNRFVYALVSIARAPKDSSFLLLYSIAYIA